jgi:hypothetical protein
MKRYHRFPLADIGFHHTDFVARQVLIDMDAVDAIVEGIEPNILSVICDGIEVHINATFAEVAALIDPPGKAYENRPDSWPTYPANVRRMEDVLSDESFGSAAKRLAEAQNVTANPTDAQPSVDGANPPATITTEDGTTITTATEQGAQ